MLLRHRELSLTPLTVLPSMLRTPGFHCSRSRQFCFPDGILPLKVFETRYIDMVRECMKREAPFGVVLIKIGQEVGAGCRTGRVGCLATSPIGTCRLSAC